jgi:hypothetical protein
MLDWLRYDLPYGLRNLWRWLPIIWEDRDWDYVYLLRVMEAKMRWMSVCLRDHGHLLHSDRYARQLAVCAALAKRIREDNYHENLIDVDITSYKYWSRAERNRKNDLAYLGKMIGKYLSHWWD